MRLVEIVVCMEIHHVDERHRLHGQNAVMEIEQLRLERRFAESGSRHQLCSTKWPPYRHVVVTAQPRQRLQRIACFANNLLERFMRRMQIMIQSCLFGGQTAWRRMAHNNPRQILRPIEKP